MSSASSSRTLTLKSLSHQDTYLKSLGVKGFEVSHRGSKLSFHLFYERQCTSFSVFQRVTSLAAGQLPRLRNPVCPLCAEARSLHKALPFYQGENLSSEPLAHFSM